MQRCAYSITIKPITNLPKIIMHCAFVRCFFCKNTSACPTPNYEPVISQTQEVMQ